RGREAAPPFPSLPPGDPRPQPGPPGMEGALPCAAQRDLQSKRGLAGRERGPMGRAMGSELRRQGGRRGLSLHELGCSGQQERISSQLIFLVCRASSLTGWVGLDRLLEMLQQLKHCICYIPVALVRVIVQEDPELDLEQEVKALRWLKCLLDGVFCCDLLPGHEGTEQEVQVQVAVYQSGWPQRALEVKRAACQAIRAALKITMGKSKHGAYMRHGSQELLWELAEEKKSWVQEAWEQNRDGRIEIWHSGFGETLGEAMCESLGRGAENIDFPCH
uniref:C2orf72-like C-terminal domain-containing protein n=1 Tax=Chelonoidis abingdonii TaxID=106734 RepID=A0A8C0IWN4_CHEAB